MKNIYKLFPLLIIISIFVSSCGKADDIIEPTHALRVPRASNLVTSFDTTSTGFYRVKISWIVASTNNLKDFEIYRKKNDEKFFFLSGGITSTNFVDSSLSNKTDSVKLFYYVNGRGIDRFIGQSSDTAFILLTKSF